jgi:hypothetical protein
MPASNSYFITASSTAIYAWMRRRCPRLMCYVKCLVARLSEKITLFVKCHYFSLVRISE